MKRCARCGEEKTVSEFSFENKHTGRRSTICKSCVRAYSRAHYEANKTAYRVRIRRTKRLRKAARLDYIVRYLEAHPCVDCGEGDPLVLEFDHLRDKEFNIGRDFNDRPWREVLAEIAKCEVRCANCHRRRTAERGGFLRHILTEQS